MKRSTAIAVLSAAGLAFSSLAAAQEQGPQTRTAQRLKPAIVGARVGIANVNTIEDNVLNYGVIADYAVTDTLRVGGTFDYWQKPAGTIGEVAYNVNDMAFGAHGKLLLTDLTTRGGVQPYALAGLALHRLSRVKKVRGNANDIDPYQTKAESVSGELGLDFGVGANYSVQENIDVTGEVLYRNIIETTVGLDQLAFTGGVNYAL